MKTPISAATLAARSAGLRRMWQRPGHREKMKIAREKGAASNRAILDGLVAEMFKDYETGLSLAAVGRKYNRGHGCVAELFTRRGYALRNDSTNPNAVHLSNGCFAAALPLTKAQIQKLIDTEPRLRVPVALKLEWRKWSLERRGDFIRRLRARLKSPEDRPELPFSSNVEPFDYASPRAQAMAAEVNKGLSSRDFIAKIDVRSQGVIYKNRL